MLFRHGGPGAAGAMWSYLAARMPEFRCLLLDRPGTGLSDPHLLTDPAAVRAEAATMVADVLATVASPSHFLWGDHDL